MRFYRAEKADNMKEKPFEDGDIKGIGGNKLKKTKVSIILSVLFSIQSPSDASVLKDLQLCSSSLVS
ncbi:hypothetical protein ILYODFUR_014833 [Ilyodon furcidens]|uniref:Uncharacterized protein n=1 Tax=Ilyodon furcidens TaxID=33524 RepID=A0ABV0SZN4_9TELE